MAKTINTKEFNILSKKYNPKNVCDTYSHDFAKEIDICSTGDYICLKCYMTVNECDLEKYKKSVKKG